MSKPTITVRLAVSLVATLIAGAAAFLVWQVYGGPRSTVVFTTAPGLEPETTWGGLEPFVVDPVAGFRPRRSSTWRHPMTALGATVPDAIEKHRDAHAFLRDSELLGALDHPCVVVVGDSHVDGVVSTPDNFTSLMEERATADGAPCYFLNAGCGFYSVYQSVLRARDLLPRYHPKVIVIVVFLGNDFLDLEKTTVPYLDDELGAMPPGEQKGPETTSARQKELALPATHELLFWQGMNQALYLHRNPARLEVLVRKAACAVDLMEQAAITNGARVLWVMLPSFDLVFESVVAGLGPVAKEVVAGSAQRRIRVAFAAVLAQRKANVVDLEPVFRADGDASQYATDFHIYRRGHRHVAEALHAPVDELLRR